MMNWCFWSDNMLLPTSIECVALYMNGYLGQVGHLFCHGQEMYKLSISLCDAMDVETDDSIFFVYIFLGEKGGYT